MKNIEYTCNLFVYSFMSISCFPFQSRLSLKLQEETLTLAVALRSVTSASLTITAMKTAPGKHLESMSRAVQHGTFRGVPIKTCDEAQQEVFNRQR